MQEKWLEEIYEKYKQEIFRFLLVLLKEPQTAEDVLQETFLKVYLHRSKYVHLQYEKAWIYQIARNIAFDTLRKRCREFPSEKENIDMLLEKTTHLSDEHGDFFYLEMIADLSEIEKEIVSLKIVAGLTHKEIGKILHMTTASVKKRYERAINKLKVKYKGVDDNE